MIRGIVPARVPVQARRCWKKAASRKVTVKESHMDLDGRSKKTSGLPKMFGLSSASLSQKIHGASSSCGAESRSSIVGGGLVLEPYPMPEVSEPSVRRRVSSGPRARSTSASFCLVLSADTRNSFPTSSISNPVTWTPTQVSYLVSPQTPPSTTHRAGIQHPSL